MPSLGSVVAIWSVCAHAWTTSQYTNGGIEIGEGSSTVVRHKWRRQQPTSKAVPRGLSFEVLLGFCPDCEAVYAPYGDVQSPLAILNFWDHKHRQHWTCCIDPRSVPPHVLFAPRTSSPPGNASGPGQNQGGLRFSAVECEALATVIEAAVGRQGGGLTRYVDRIRAATLEWAAAQAPLLPGQRRRFRYSTEDEVRLMQEADLDLDDQGQDGEAPLNQALPSLRPTEAIGINNKPLPPLPESGRAIRWDLTPEQDRLSLKHGKSPRLPQEPHHSLVVEHEACDDSGYHSCSPSDDGSERDGEKDAEGDLTIFYSPTCISLPPSPLPLSPSASPAHRPETAQAPHKRHSPPALRVIIPPYDGAVALELHSAPAPRPPVRLAGCQVHGRSYATRFCATCAAPTHRERAISPSAIASPSSFPSFGRAAISPSCCSPSSASAFAGVGRSEGSYMSDRQPLSAPAALLSFAVPTEDLSVAVQPCFCTEAGKERGHRCVTCCSRERSMEALGGSSFI